MARVPSGNSNKSAEQNSTEGTEPEVNDTPAVEGTEPEASGTPAVSTDKPAEAEIDLKPFEAAVAQAVEAADRTTGDVALAPLANVQKEYAALATGKPKNRAKDFLQEQMREALASSDIVLTKIYMFLGDNLKGASSGGGTERKPANPVEAYIEQNAALRLAVTTLPIPEGVEFTDEVKAAISSAVEEGTNLIEAYRAWLNRDEEHKDDKEPEGITPVVRAAVRFQTGKATGRKSSGGGSTGPRRPGRDIAEHIANAFANQADGTFLTVAQIVNTPSEGYPAGDLPSPGAVNARLFPKTGKTTLVGVEPVEETPEGKTKAVRGARKVAVAAAASE